MRDYANGHNSLHGAISSVARLAVVIITLAALASCAGNREAKKVVKEFLDTNLKDESYDTEYFSKVDSTFLISDSLVEVMRKNTKACGFFRDIKYSEGGKTKKLNFIMVRYRIGDKTIRQTFYLDDKTTRVVCLKNDA